MSRRFIDGSEEYLEAAGAPVTEWPISVSIWFNGDDVSRNTTMFEIVDASSTNQWCRLMCNTSDGVLRWNPRGGTNRNVYTTNAASDGVWHHGFGVTTDDTDHLVILDGDTANEGTSTDDTSFPTGIDVIGVGRIGDSSDQHYWDGMLAECGVWDVALTRAEGAVLAAGYSPLLIRPGNLVFYLPMVRDEDNDIVGGLSMTAGGTPTVDIHPRIIYPSAQILQFPSAAAPAGGGLPAGSLGLLGVGI